MKKLLFIAVLFVLSVAGYAQGVSVNDNGIAADPSAMLDISSHDKGVLIPRLRTNERTSIVGPANGLMVYDIDTQSFWYCTYGTWKEILKAGDPLLPTGPAGGDLSGNYPTPNVVKLQNLDVSNAFPFDKQVLKWDALANNWKGRNDSLFLPYNVAFGDAGKLFGIQNNNTSNGASAICGKSSTTGSGITPAGTMGVWGDNSNGLGVVGTSNTGIGTYGFSFGNHGVYGYSTLANFAGVCGTHANANGIGVLGEVQNTGKAVYGRSTGATGKAGVFETTNTSNNDTTFLARSGGYGVAGFFTNSNAINGNPILEVQSSAQGDGIYSELLNTGNYANANFRAYNQSLGGYAFYGQTERGNACYLYNTGNTNNSYVLDAKTVGLGAVGNFTIANSANSNYILQGTSNGLGGGLNLSLTNVSDAAIGMNMTHSGTGNGLVVSAKKGKAAVFSNTDGTNTLNVVETTNVGTNKAASFVTNNATNNAAVVSINTNGTGYGLDALVTNAASTAPAVYAVSLGSTGIAGYGVTTAIFGHSTSLTNGVGVFGQTSIGNPNGIGVKGVSSSTVLSSGAVTGISNANGVAVYGESTAGGVALYGKTSRPNGAAVYGLNEASQGQAIRGSATGTDGISIYGESGVSASNSIAGYFRNYNATNSRNVMHLQGNGTGKTLYLESTNASNTADMIYGKNNGSGNFLLLTDNGGLTITTIAKDGDITTDGTITVHSNKGIVRNSTGIQLRTEILTASIPSGSVNHYDSEFNAWDYVDITFGTAFSSTPSVYLGNRVSGHMMGLTINIVSVTTTGCTLEISNFTPYDFTYGASSYKIIAIGAE